MSGGAWEYVMGVYADASGNPRSGYSTSNNSGFNGIVENQNGTVATYSSGRTFPDSKYYNLYTGSSYYGHALSETQGFSKHGLPYGITYAPWYIRGGVYDDINSGIFSPGVSGGMQQKNISSRFVITNE